MPVLAIDSDSRNTEGSREIHVQETYHLCSYMAISSGAFIGLLFRNFEAST